jgi:hypothetical protein
MSACLRSLNLPRPSLAAPLAALVASVGITACASEDLPPEPQGGFAVTASALGTCSGTADKNPFSEINGFRLVVRDTNADGTVKPEKIFDETQNRSGQGDITFKGVPAHQNVEVTLQGLTGGNPSWFARATNVNIVKSTVNSLKVVMMAVEGFSCLPKPNTGPAPAVAFANATRIANGRILLTGGFTSSTANPDGSTTLSSPTDAAYLFDPATGAVTKSKGKMVSPRGAHSAVYLPNSNQVLIVGGIGLNRSMKVAKDGTPPSWVPADGADPRFEIYDVKSDSFIAGNGNQFARQRVLPNLMLLGGDYVAAVGGGPWPRNDDQKAYAQADVFSPKAGGYLEAGDQIAMKRARGGAAMAWMGTTKQGTARYFLWGGNVLKAKSQILRDGQPPTTLEVGAGPIAERFEESTQPGSGEMYADFLLKAEDGVNFPGNCGPDGCASALLFPTLTRVSNAANGDVRFVSVGGLRVSQTGAEPTWAAADAGEVWLLTVTEPDPAANKAGVIATRRLPGLASGVYFHNATVAGDNLVVAGGFSGFGQPAAFQMQALNLSALQWFPTTKLAAAAAFVPRGGAAGIRLNNDCLLQFGGVGSYADLSQANASVLADVYCSKLLLP